MKKLIIVFIFIVSCTSVYSQQYRLGLRADFLTGNEYINWQAGPSLVLKYSLTNLPLSIQGSTRFYLAEMNGSKLSSGYTYTDFSFGVSVNYYPIHWAIEPYAGFGIFYNSNNFSKDGMYSLFNNKYVIYPDKIKNNISEEVTLGIDFSAESPINFIVEVVQTFNSPGKIITRNLSNNDVLKEENLNLNSLFIKIGLSFRI
jgi:hypothetical protein